MIAHCLFCGHEFPKNETVERFPVGTRIAFDPVRGRLWSVCNGCRRWTLAPIESRWEALEELERIAVDRAKLLVQGENVALLHFDTIDLVRVGRTALREESWWRYGSELARRHTLARQIVRRGRIISSVITSLIIGFPIWSHHPDTDVKSIDRARRKQFGRLGWQGLTACLRCGSTIPKLLFEEHDEVRLRGDERLELRIPCPKCRANGYGALVGSEATDILRRLLAYRNFTGATEAEVHEATALIEGVGSPSGLVEGVQRKDLQLSQLSRVGALGLEIAVNEQVESDQLATEVRAVERDWRDAEEVAAIADGELTPLYPREALNKSHLRGLGQ